MKLPTRGECLSLLKEEGTPDNIIRHTLTVADVAVFLARHLKEKGIDVNVELVEKGALLHDIKKWAEIVKQTSKMHGEAGSDALKEKYPEVANLVKKHMMYEILENVHTWEEKIITYADRRVNHDEVVSLDERFEYLNKRYPSDNHDKRNKVMKKYQELESELFKILDMNPSDLKDMI